MKVMIVNTYYYPEIVGGAEYSVKKLAEKLQEIGNNVVVLCTGENNVIETINGIKVIRIKPQVPCRAINAHSASKRKKLIRRLKDIWNYKNERIIDEILKKEKPDVIHTNGLYDISPIIWKIAKKNKIRVVHTIRDYYLRCPKVSFECSYGSDKCSLYKVYCHFHFKQNLKASNYVDYVTAPSSFTLRTMTELGFFYNAKKEVIPNAIDINQNKLDECKTMRVSNLEKKQKIRFVFLGTLSENKGIVWLIESLKKISCERIELNIAGKGELQSYIESAAKIDNRIKYHGFLSEDEINKLLLSNEVLICPSLWNEPFGRVVLDAYKNGLPVIASNMGALPDIVEDNVTGTIVKASAVKDLCNAIMKYVLNDNLIIQQSEAALLKVKEYSIEKQASLFIQHAYLERN